MELLSNIKFIQTKMKEMKKSKSANSYFNFLFNRRFSKSKHSQSTIIATVLLILLVIVITGVIISVVLPFVRERIAGTSCFDLTGQFEIKNDPDYTCYDADGPDDISGNVDDKVMYIRMGVADIEGEIYGFKAVLETDGSAIAYDIVKDPTQEIYMYGDTAIPPTHIEMPGKDEERTYEIRGVEKPDAIKVYPVLTEGPDCSEVFDRVDFIEDC